MDSFPQLKFLDGPLDRNKSFTVILQRSSDTFNRLLRLPKPCPLHCPCVDYVEPICSRGSPCSNPGIQFPESNYLKPAVNRHLLLFTSCIPTSGAYHLKSL